MVDVVTLSALGLARHLRLPLNAPAGEGFSVALNGAAHLLVQECGAHEALRRLCGLPVPLPQAILDALAALDPDERRELIHTLVRTVPSPLTSVHLLRILLLFKADSPAYERLARRIVHRLTGEQGASEFKAFRRLLCWVEVTSDSWDGGATLSPHLKLALVWAHAHRLLAILSVRGLPLDWVPEESQPARLHIPANLFSAEDEYSLDVAGPFRQSRAPFLLSALAYGAGDADDTFVDEVLQSMVVGATFYQVGDQTYPSLDLLHDLSGTANSLHSFLGDDAVQRYARLIGDEAATVLQPEQIQAELVKTIAGLRTTPTNVHGWVALKEVLGDLPSASGVAEPLIELIVGTNFKNLFSENITTGVLAMQTATVYARHLASEQVCTHLESELLEIASFLATRTQVPPPIADSPSTEPTTAAVGSNSDDTTTPVHIDWTDDRLGDYLMEWGYYLARASESGESMASKMADLLGSLVTKWPILASNCTKSTSNMAWTLPFDLARPFWSLLVRLRAEPQAEEHRPRNSRTFRRLIEG